MMTILVFFHFTFIPVARGLRLPTCIHFSSFRITAKNRGKKITQTTDILSILLITEYETKQKSSPGLNRQGKVQVVIVEGL